MPAVNRVRNFWITADVDGRECEVTGVDPTSKDGGFTLTIYIKNAGYAENAIQVTGRAHGDGTLTLDVNAASALYDSTVSRVNGFVITTMREEEAS